MSKISAVVNTWNEEENLPRCLGSVKDWVDEIVVMDMKSTDRTQEIAKSYGAKVFTTRYTGYVEPARNLAVGQASGDWILILDADEQIPESLAKKLKKISSSKKSADFYRLPRKNIIFGKWIKHSRWWPDYNVRFFKKGKVSWSEIIHSVPETRGQGIDLRPTEQNAILHHNYDSIEQYLERSNRYTSLQAKLLIKEGYKFSWQDLIRKPTEEFLSRYFSGEGYRDGVHGLALALLQAFSELSLYLKVWQVAKFRQESADLGEVVRVMKESGKEANFWQADALVKSGAGLMQRIKRKLKLP